MKLILCGGGAGEKNTLANAKLNEIIDNSKPILYVPLAFDEDEHPYDSCFEWIQEELKNVQIPYIDMVRTFEELASKKYNEYSAMFIGGGNTYKLLKGLKESGSFNKIKEYIENDGVVLGSSAGTVIFSEDIDIISSMDPNDVKLMDTKGFGVLNGISFFPHYTNIKKKLSAEENELRTKRFTDSIIEFSYNSKVIAIPEEDAIYVNGDTYEVIGTLPYYIFNKGQFQKFEISMDEKARKL